jgi:VanZ family protein
VASTKTYHRILLAAYVAALFWLTLAPMPMIPASREVVGVIPALDKAIHFVLFGGLALLLFWNLGWNSRFVTTLLPVALALTLAALVELVQDPLPYRSGDFLDFAAGAAGALVVAAAVALWGRGRRRRASPA